MILLPLPRQVISSFVVATIAGVIVPSLHSQPNYATPYFFTTLAGNGTEGSVDGAGSAASFFSPRDVAVDAARNVYVADRANRKLRKISPTGLVTTPTGPGGTPLVFTDINSLTIDSSGNLYIGAYFSNTILKLTPDGVLITLAGQQSVSGAVDGTGSAARFNGPAGITVDPSGNLFVGDSQNHAIRKITPAGVVTTVAGLPGTRGTADGTGSAARFDHPSAIDIDLAGNLYVADSLSHTVRKITPAGVVTTLAGVAGSMGTADGTGSAARFAFPAGLAVDSAGNVYVSSSQTVRKITPAGVTTTLAGASELGSAADGLGSAAGFTQPFGLVVDAGGNVYVADGSNTIRRSVFPPTFTAPVENRVTQPGSSVSFTANLTSDYPMTFQWRKNGVPIPGATNTTLTITNAQLVDSAFYSLVAANIAGSTTSNDAYLTFTAPPVITSQPVGKTVTIGSTVQFNVTALPVVGLRFAWRKNGNAIPGATNSTFTLPNVTLNDAGNYSVDVDHLNPFLLYSTRSNVAALTVVSPPTITTQPVNQTVIAGAAAQFSVVATPASGPAFQWRKNGVAIPGATNASFGIANTALSDAGTYSVVVTYAGVSVPSANAALTVIVPVSTQAVTHTVTVGSSVQMNFTGAPTGTTFQWRKEGVPITGATNASYTINTVALTDAGNYNVTLTTGGVSQTSNTATLIVVPVSAPTMVVQPASQTVVIGSPVTFSVVASSPVAMTFQWRKNGAPIPGATNEAFSVASATQADAAAYSVAVTNSAGTTVSNSATLIVNTPIGTAPTFSAHPADQTVNAGATITLNFSAAGTQPLGFQWFKNGTLISGATGIVLSIPNAQPSDAATYTAVVSNSAGSASSNSAVVQVIAPPAIARQPVSQSANIGGNAQLEVVATGTGPLAYQWLKDGVSLAGATGATLVFNSLRVADAGNYTVVVSNSAGSITSAAAALAVGPGSRLSNVSIRTTLAAAQTVIVGIAVEGGAREVLMRAVGPGLAGFGLSSAMVDPQIELFRGQVLAFANDDWPASLVSTFASVGAFGLSLGSRDAALLQRLNGAFSIQARGSTPGVVLVEAYDLGTGNVPRLVNVSARNRVGTGDDILIAGFTLTGTGTKQLLIRAIGPGLMAFGVPGTLVDPRLDLFDSTGARLAENDNWTAALVPTFNSVGAFGLSNGSRDAALLTTLPVGSYSVQVRGADGGTGEAIVEIYEVPSAN